MDLTDRFVFPIPESIPSELAAPLFCAGVTVFSPLVRSDIGPSSSVGVIGLGGLGHYAIMLARALGSERVVVLSHSPGKREDALALGATDFVASSTAGDRWEQAYIRSLDVILCTASFQDSMPLSTYLSLLKVGGTFYSLGMPEGTLPAVSPVSLVYSNISLRGSNIGNRKEILQMLDLVDKKGVKSWIQLRKMREAGQVLEEMENGKGRYRWVLEMDID
jgi:alcohol dehydrogenase (NADP+)